MRFLILVLAAAVSFIAPSHAQIVKEMSPELIREAIVFGMKVKVVEPYRIQEKAHWSWPPLIGVYTTPYLRVALAANNAKRHYKQFSEADVTREMIAPEIHVYASPQPLQGAEIANVETIVVLPKRSRDLSQAIHPIRMSEASEEYKNLFGFSGQGRGMLAVFPIDIWREDNEIHVVFDRGIPSSQGSSAVGGCTDCKSNIYLSKIR